MYSPARDGCELDTNSYQKFIKASDKEFQAINIHRAEIRTEWNYTIRPCTTLLVQNEAIMNRWFLNKQFGLLSAATIYVKVLTTVKTILLHAPKWLITSAATRRSSELPSSIRISDIFLHFLSGFSITSSRFAARLIRFLKRALVSFPMSAN